MKATIWHNPRCGTSRNVLAILEEAGADVTVFEYLKEPLSPDRLRRLFAKAGMTPRDALRAKEPAADALKDATDDQIVDAMMLNPILINRPLVETDKGAMLARPSESVRDIL